jgi:hypothetical protein
MMILEQSVQEALRAREEMIAAEAAEAPQVAAKTTKTPQVTRMQGRSSPEAQDMRERGLLMFEHAQRIVD